MAGRPASAAGWPAAGQALVGGEGTDQAMTRRQAVLTALAFSWLNPHAWLDTAVLIGTASLAWGRPGNQLFGAGRADRLAALVRCWARRPSGSGAGSAPSRCGAPSTAWSRS